MVVWLPKEVILEHLPAKFNKKNHTKIRCVIDCSEVFTERPKAVDIQAATWSDYKKHNTVKFLIGISPTGFITFLSDCYGGRASDQFICKDSGFYELLDPYDEIMADRGFQIREELLLQFCTLTCSTWSTFEVSDDIQRMHKDKESCQFENSCGDGHKPNKELPYF